MKLVQKIELSSKVHEVLVPAGCDFIHADIELGKISVYMQTEVTPYYNQDMAYVRFGLFEAGEPILEAADYFATVTDEDYQVWLIYILSVDYLSDDDDEEDEEEDCGCDGVVIIQR